MNPRATRIISLIVTLIAGMILTFVPTISLAVELRLTDDARTESGQPDTKFGTGNQNLRVRSATKSYLKFDLSVLPAGTVGSDVAKATLKLWTDSATTTGSFDVQRVIGPWVEGGPTGITWNNAPPLGAIAGTGTVTESLSFTVVDVTQLVKDWLDVGYRRTTGWRWWQ